MKTYGSRKIQIQSFQLTPQDSMLKMDASETLAAISSLREEDKALQSLVGKPITLLDLLSRFKDDRSSMSRILNHFIEVNQEKLGISWDGVKKGIRVSDERVLEQGRSRSILTALVAQFRADGFFDGKPYFIITLKNPLYFDRNLNAEDFVDFFKTIKHRLYLPAYDKKRSFSMIARHIMERPVYYKETVSSALRSQRKSLTYGEILKRSGRMSAEEFAEMLEANKEFPFCMCTGYSSYSKSYLYAARDVEIIASDSLIKLSNDNPLRELPEELSEAIGLYKKAKEQIRGEMDARDDLLDSLLASLKIAFSVRPPIDATCHYIYTPRYKLKGRQPVNEEIKTGQSFYVDVEFETGANVLCYPTTENGVERKDKFLRYTSPGAKFTQHSLFFEVFDYSNQMAVNNPIATADRLLEEHPGCTAALVTWATVNYNNKPLEFELMRRGVAVQHVIDQGLKVNAQKISPLIKGMTEKFPIKPPVVANDMVDLGPFDYAMGLDVSRHDKVDVASFPLVVDKTGNVDCLLADSPYTEEKEKRKETEILQQIQLLTDGRSGSVNVLFLRDGNAFEDYASIAKELPDDVSLTVLSVRKNLMNTVSEDMPEGMFYGLFAEHDGNRFLFGINARQGEKTKVTRLHMCEIVLNPLGLSTEQLGNILIDLSGQNKTTETEVGSLPFPIAYADRMAWTIRDMIQNRGLKMHVREHYPEEVTDAGGEERFIYRIIREFVATRANGYSFAI